MMNFQQPGHGMDHFGRSVVDFRCRAGQRQILHTSPHLRTMTVKNPFHAGISAIHHCVGDGLGGGRIVTERIRPEAIEIAAGYTHQVLVVERVEAAGLAGRDDKFGCAGWVAGTQVAETEAPVTLRVLS